MLQIWCSQSLHINKLGIRSSPIGYDKPCIVRTECGIRYGLEKLVLVVKTGEGKKSWEF